MSFLHATSEREYPRVYYSVGSFCQEGTGVQEPIVTGTISAIRGLLTPPPRPPDQPLHFSPWDSVESGYLLVAVESLGWQVRFMFCWAISEVR
jgi:hypothetical protein